MSDLKVALIQSQQFWEDKQSNLQHFDQHLETIESSVDLIVLPEMFNTSFSMNAKENAESMNGPSVKWLIQKANEKNATILASLIIEEEGQYYNRMVSVSPDGVQAHYNKRHLFRMADEHLHYSPGKERVVINIAGWKVLLQVCYDLRFPVFSRNKTIGDETEYDLMVYIANWPAKRSEIWSTLLRARAIENQTYCIGVNRVGVDGNDIEYSGDSQLIDPWGNVDFQFAKNEEGVKILTIEKARIEHIRAAFPAFKDAD